MECLYFLFLVFAFLFSSDGHADERAPLRAYETCLGTRALQGVVQAVTPFGDIKLAGGVTLVIADTHFLSDDPAVFLPEKTKNILVALLKGQTIFYLKTQNPDRYRRQPAHIWIKEKENASLWLQQTLFQRRLALFMPAPLKARLTKRDCSLRKIMPNLPSPAQRFLHDAHDRDLSNRQGEFVIIKGVVHSIYQGKSAVNWNFGKNWRRDFSLSIPNAIKFNKEGDKELNGNMIGKTVRVRGYLDLSNGPFIRIEHPDQIEIEK